MHVIKVEFQCVGVTFFNVIYEANALRSVAVWFYVFSFAIVFCFGVVVDCFLFICVSLARENLYGRLNMMCRIRESREQLLQCPVENCDGSGHISGNFSSHRRQAAPRSNICVRRDVHTSRTRAVAKCFAIFNCFLLI